MYGSKLVSQFSLLVTLGLFVGPLAPRCGLRILHGKVVDLLGVLVPGLFQFLDLFRMG